MRAARTPSDDDREISAEELFAAHLYTAELDAALAWEAGSRRHTVLAHSDSEENA